MTIAELIAAAEQRFTTALAERQSKQESLIAMRSAVESGDATITDESVSVAIAARDAADAALSAAEAKVAELKREQAEDERLDALAREVHPTGTERRVRDSAVRVGQEARTYRPDQDKRGGQFVRDVVMSHLGDFGAQERLSQHMREERVERAEWFERAAGTGAFAGLVVPQYLTDLVAPKARAGRPLADVIRSLPLPADGMTASISRITTGTTTALQTEANPVSETDIDDTLLSVSVQTNAGSQTVTRQAVERGTGTMDVVLEDLFRAYHTGIDSTLLNQATNGLTNVATAITYTSASPTAAELYPKLLGGPAAVEAALLDQDPGDVVAVMHSRRWYWVQSQLSSTFPLIGQGFGLNVAGMADGSSKYGSGFRGVLPSGIPVVVDNNIATNLGAGTNQDEIYFISRNESFLWEDASAPMMIRTETGPSVKSLGIDVVVYGYFAYTFGRLPHAQKISGTGLVAPTF